MSRLLFKIKVFVAGLLATAIGFAQTIEISDLSTLDRNFIGIISAQQADIPADFFANASTKSLVDAYSDQKGHKFYSLGQFIHRLSLVELAGPPADANQGRLFNARVRHLIDIGAIDEADALLRKSEISNPQRFALWFEVQLLREDPILGCTPLRNQSELSADIATTIYCLAINQDWFAAELLLASAMELGQLEKDSADLLLGFLEPDNLEGRPPPSPPSQSVLEITIAEALALPYNISTIPAGFLHRDLSEDIGWITRIRTAERLARGGAISPRYLKEVYSQGSASASGALWDRVRAANTIKKISTSSDSELICKEFLQAWAQFNDPKLLPIFSRMYAEEISHVAFSSEQCIEKQILLILLHPNRASLLFDLLVEIKTDDILYGLSTGDFSKTNPKTNLEASILMAYIDAPVSKQNSAELLGQLATVRDGIESDPRNIGKAIKTLNAKGLEKIALDLAFEAIVLERAN
ncbi:MAG: hypothetical protein AAF429_08490 [Pseudomonadota bacterium]